MAQDCEHGSWAYYCPTCNEANENDARIATLEAELSKAKAELAWVKELAVWAVEVGAWVGDRVLFANRSDYPYDGTPSGILAALEKAKGDKP